MKRSPSISLALALLLSLSISCGRYSNIHYISFDGESWERSEPKEWSATLRDTALYDVTLHLRHTIDYEYDALNCAISLYGEGGSHYRDTLCFHLADENGYWLGDGGGLKSLALPVGEGPLYFEAGEVRVRVEQISSESELRGLRHIGVSFVKSASQELRGEMPETSAEASDEMSDTSDEMMEASSEASE